MRNENRASLGEGEGASFAHHQSSVRVNCVRLGGGGGEGRWLRGMDGK